MVEMARKKNSIPLQIAPNAYGCVILPREQDCLTSINYQVEPRRSSERTSESKNTYLDSNSMDISE